MYVVNVFWTQILSHCT